MFVHVDFGCVGGFGLMVVVVDYGCIGRVVCRCVGCRFECVVCCHHGLDPDPEIRIRIRVLLI